MAEPQPLDELLQRFRISKRTMYRLIAECGLERYQRIGDRRTYLDPDEVEKALTPRPKPPK